MRRRLSTLFCRYEPRLLSRSTTILKPSTRICCSIVWRTFEAAIGFSASRFGARFRVGGVSARTGAILIRDRSLWRHRGQRVVPSGGRGAGVGRGLGVAIGRGAGPVVAVLRIAPKLPTAVPVFG